MVEWTDELRKQVVEDYLAAEPTPVNTMDIAKQIADDIGATANGVRGILTKADVYIKKTTAASTTTDDGKPKAVRVNKAEAQGQLTELIESIGKEADADIIGKLTGKAALYLVETFKQ